MMDQILELELARAIESAERKSVPTPDRDPMLADESDSFEAQTAEPVLVSEPVAGDPADIDP
jgi:hypothetical protein